MHDPSELMKGSFLERAQGVSALRNAGVLTTDEARQNFDLNPVGGPEGQQRWRPANTGIDGLPPEQPQDTVT